MWLLFASLNPVSEAIRSVFSKKASRSVDPLIISWFNNFVPVIIFTPFLFFIELKFNNDYLFATLMTGTINLFATIYYMRAISESDISKVMPMLSFTPLFLLITSPLIVGEFPNIWGIAGIFLIVIGSYLLNINIRSKNIFSPFKTLLIEKGTRDMLIVAFLWSLSANYDKIAIENSSMMQHISGINLFLFTGMTIIAVSRKKINFDQIKKEKINLLLMSSCTVTSFIFHMSALSLTLVAYVVALKRLSGLLSVFLGFIVFNDKNLRERLLGAFVMFLGVMLIIFF